MTGAELLPVGQPGIASRGRVACWADNGLNTLGETKPCFVEPSTGVGLCSAHYDEIVGGT